MGASDLDISEQTYGELFELKATGRQKSMMRIVQAAIASYARVGLEGTTYDAIARLSDVSRPLVHKYFPDKREIFLLAVKYIRLEFQRLAIAAIEKAPDPRAMLRAYVDSTFDWVRTRPEHFTVWMLFLSQATVDAELLQVNTELARVGHARIVNLLKLGAQAGVFELGQVERQAKQIQVAISGALLITASEAPEAMHEGLQEETVAACLRIAGFRG